MDESASDSDGEELQLKVNKRFAKEFEEKNRKADLLRAERSGLLNKDADSDSDDDDESEDEHAHALTPKLDFDIMKTISMIHNKDKRIYDEKFNPFEKDSAEQKSSDDDSDDDDNDDDDEKEEDDEMKAKASKSKKKKEDKKEKGLRYKDLVRQQVLKQTENGDASQVFEDSDTEDKAHTMDTEAVPTYNAEQRRLKDAFKAQASRGLSAADESDSDDDEDADVLRKKEKTKEELEAEEDNFKRYMSTLAKRDPRMRKARKEDVDLLETFFKEPAKDKDEAFLRSFFLNQTWADQDGSGAAFADAANGKGADEGEGGEDDDDEEDEEALEAADRFEAKYNFRHEEPGSTDLMETTFDPHSSVRRKESSRKRQRDAKRQRKQEEKERRKEELRRLKNLKRKELEKRLEKSIEMAGLSGDAKLVLKPEDLDGDFDPEEFDRKMAAMFNDAYYDEEDEGFEATGDVDAEKKLFGDIGGDEDEDDDDDDGAKTGGATGDGDDDDDDDDYDNVKIVERPEDDPSTQAALKEEKEMDEAERKRKKKREKALAAGGKAVSVADLKGKVINDELYKMDYDDVIGGDIKTRFKYRKVTPNSYGLTTAEILFADEDLLNSFVSIKRMAPYVEKEWIATGKHRRRFREALRAREAGLTQRKEKKKKRERRKAKKLGAEAEDSDAESAADGAFDDGNDNLDNDAEAKSAVPLDKKDNEDDEGEEKKSKKKSKKRKRKRKHKGEGDGDGDGDGDEDPSNDAEDKAPKDEDSRRVDRKDNDNDDDDNDDGKEKKSKKKRRRKRKKTNDGED